MARDPSTSVRHLLREAASSSARCVRAPEGGFAEEEEALEDEREEEGDAERSPCVWRRRGGGRTRCKTPGCCS